MKTVYAVEEFDYDYTRITAAFSNRVDAEMAKQRAEDNSGYGPSFEVCEISLFESYDEYENNNTE